MSALSNAHRMTAYMAWADDVMLSNAEKLPVNELVAPHKTLFKTITGTFDHILVVGEIFKAHIEGYAHHHTNRFRSEPFKFEDIAERLRLMNNDYVGLAKSWTKEELNEPVKFNFIDGGEGVMTREEILLHLVNHATYHRGFISTLMFPIAPKIKPNDFTVFIRDVWPETSKHYRRTKK